MYLWRLLQQWEQGGFLPSTFSAWVKETGVDWVWSYWPGTNRTNNEWFVVWSLHWIEPKILQLKISSHNPNSRETYSVHFFVCECRKLGPEHMERKRRENVQTTKRKTRNQCRCVALGPSWIENCKHSYCNSSYNSIQHWHKYSMDLCTTNSSSFSLVVMSTLKQD